MRVVIVNTGTELLLGDIQDAHLSFIAHEIFPLDLRVEERRTLPDGSAIRDALEELFGRAEILFVTGGLGPTTDDITRETVADLLGLELHQNAELLASLRQRLEARRIKWTSRIGRQANVPMGAQILPNENGSAPGLYFPANISPRVSSPHLFLLPGPPRELQPMFRRSVLPILRSIVPFSDSLKCRIYRVVGMGESLIEEAIGPKILAIPKVELGYCARPGDVDVRILGEASALDRAEAIIRTALGASIYSTTGHTIEETIVKLLSARNETLAVAESCTGGLLANRITNVPGASEVFVAGYVCYANQAKIDILDVDRKLIEKHGAVSEAVSRALAENARRSSGSTYAIATTGIAGPTGGSADKPIGTVYITFASANSETIAKKFFFPSDRETFKELAAQAAFDLLRRKLIASFCG